MINPSPSKTAILIFSLSEEAEKISKPFLQQNGGLKNLNSLIKRKVDTIGVDYFHYTEEYQKGDTFGKRIVNTIAAIFDKGYDHVITVGNDSLGLEKAHLRSAITEVENKKVVVGPSHDGGFYLLGLHKDQFDPELFLSLSWKTSKLYKELQTLLSKKEAVEYTLPYLYDLDEYHDISRNIAALSILKIEAIKWLQNLILVVFGDYKYLVLKIKKGSISTLFNKGSPIVCS